MKIFKRISLIFFAILILLSVKTFAGYQVADSNSLDDPIYTIKRQDVRSGSLESINTYISKHENGESAIGIDVSSWQGDIDWNQVSKSGVKFAIIRCGYRGRTEGKLFEDFCFKKNIEGAINNGIYVGVYFFSTALNEQEAIEEANVTLDLIRGYDIKYFVAYDFETFIPDGDRTDNLSVEQINKNGRAFLNKIKENGYTPCMYGSSSYLKDKWKMNEFSDCSTWVAHYNTNKPSYTEKYDMWQCTSNAQVNGITGPVDVDVDYKYYFKYNNVDISSCMFNSQFYADCNPDVKAIYGYNEAGLRHHYNNWGKAEGRFATPIFNARYYLNKYPDVKAAFGNNYTLAYDHFILCGAKEGRQGSKYINSTYYLDNNIDLKRAFYSSKTKALVHFYKYFEIEGRVASSEFNVRNYKSSTSSYYQYYLKNNYLKYIILDAGGNPHPDSNVDITPYMFNARYYADCNPDVKALYGYNEQELRRHYEIWGKNEGRKASRIFDPKYYLETYPDVKAAFGNNYTLAYGHFVLCGAKEGRSGSEELQVKKYLENYGDLKAAFGNYYTKAIVHYITCGLNEGRKGN